jgi:hypothetical protein
VSSCCVGLSFRFTCRKAIILHSLLVQHLTWAPPYCHTLCAKNGVFWFPRNTGAPPKNANRSLQQFIAETLIFSFRLRQGTSWQKNCPFSDRNCNDIQTAFPAGSKDKSKGKVNLSLCLSKHHAMKVYYGVDIVPRILHWSAFCPGRFTPGERARGIRWIKGWMGPRASLDAVVTAGQMLIKFSS